jgi:NAD(P)-dependent dehydrogenase (short-subunit alcohol dehydrogenase family)
MEGKVYAVTGGASGIGQAVVVRLAELGARGIAISDVNLAGLEKTKQLCMASWPLRIQIHRFIWH